MLSEGHIEDMLIESDSSNYLSDMRHISSEPDICHARLSVLEDDVLEFLNIQLVFGQLVEDVSEDSHLVEVPDA